MNPAQAPSAPPRPMPAGLRLFFSIGFPLIFIGAGSVLLAIGARGYLRAKASLDWPVAEGVVISSEVKRATSRSREGEVSVTYQAQVAYEFEAGGEKRRGERVSFGDVASSDEGQAWRVVERYPAGARVEVRHDPDDPGTSVLEPGLGVGVWVLPGLGGIFFVAGILAALFKPGMMRAIDSPDLPGWQGRK